MGETNETPRHFYAAHRFQTLEEAKAYVKEHHPDDSNWAVLAINGKPVYSLDGKTPMDPALVPKVLR